MWNDNLVIDAVAHGFDFRPENRADNDWMTPGIYEQFGKVGFWKSLHVAYESREPGYMLSWEEMSYGWTASDLADVYFGESDVDVIVYHEFGIHGLFKDGVSPWEPGLELKKAYPDRVILYAYVDALQGPKALEQMEERAATGLIDGFKVHPANGTVDPVTHQTRAVRLDNPEYAYPIYRKARDLGIKHIGVHKTMPIGPGSLAKDRPEDMSNAALAFPDMTFEVVHSGWAFLEECVMQAFLHPNIYVNMECVANLAVRRPRKFAEIIGEFLYAGMGVEDRIFFATGVPTQHPQPVLEAVANFKMPEDMREGYDYPELTDEIKAKILGLNFARMHGFDPAERLAKLKNDEWTGKRESTRGRLVESPWQAHRGRIATEGKVLQHV
jgi:predicted TIM-barrel fold metal-dependent hydrolase